MNLTSHDFALIGLLVFLEGILSVDNALVLAVLAKHLPKSEQSKALSYGLIGAFLFRFGALAMVGYLVKWVWVKYVGGAYLIGIAGKHLFFHRSEAARTGSAPAEGFWRTVIAIELTDVAFAIDSILAGIALTPKLGIVFTGGAIGIILMRFAASALIKLIDRFPRLEKSAYVLVLLIGIKVIVETLGIPGVDFHSPSAVSFWIFWCLIVGAIGYGFVPRDASSNRESKSAIPKGLTR